MDLKKYLLLGMVVFLVMASFGAIAEEAAAAEEKPAALAEAEVLAEEKPAEPPKEQKIEKPDAQQVYFGSAKSFFKPASVDFKEAVKATPEYQATKKKKIKSGSAKYWQLISQASERALRVIAKVGEETEYDLIVRSGYLEGMNPPIETTDITEIVLKKLSKKDK